MIIGAQLYTLRDYTKTIKSFDESMKRVAEIGYTCVQVSAVGNIGWQNIRDVCDKYGLTIVVTHTDQQRIIDDTDFVIEEHKIMGTNYIGIGSMPVKYHGGKEGALQFISDYKPAAKKIKDSGMTLMYHNHDFEFAKYDGKLVMDYLVEGFAEDEMGFIVDTFWVQAGGGDPCAWLRKLKGRVDTIHFKDMATVGRERRMAAVGSGNLNWPGIFAAAEEAGAKWAFVEQDNCYEDDPFDCMKASYQFLSANGYN